MFAIASLSGCGKSPLCSCLGGGLCSSVGENIRSHWQRFWKSGAESAIWLVTTAICQQTANRIISLQNGRINWDEQQKDLAAYDT